MIDQKLRCISDEQLYAKKGFLWKSADIMVRRFELEQISIVENAASVVYLAVQ